ncbi:MAG: hypothetical protein IJD78_06980 [Clostridia bacterium]|nr:hypothetical protein [Clostridia bacterium]
MFIVLKTNQPAKGFFKKYRQQRILGKSEPVAHPTENGLPFFILDISDDPKKLSLAATEEKCGRYVSRVVAPRNLHLPDSKRVKRFTPVSSGGIFLFNTALEVIKNAGLKPDGICITVTDRNARMSGEICRLLPYASSVRAVTARPERYSEACNRIYKDCGASVMVRPDYRPAGKKEIIISCDGAATAEMNNSAVFSYKRSSHGKLRFLSDEIMLSENHRKIIPPNIDTVDFAAAVTELCSGTEYRFSAFSDTETSCKKCTGAAPSECLSCYVREK